MVLTQALQMPLSNLLRSERTNLPWCGSWRFWFGLCCILNDDSVPMSILGLEACHGLGSFEFVRVEIDRFFCWNWHFNPGQMMVEYPALRIQWLEPIFPMQMAFHWFAYTPFWHASILTIPSGNLMPFAMEHHHVKLPNHVESQIYIYIYTYTHTYIDLYRWTET